MINYFQSQRLAARAGVPPEIIEKDYFVELILLYIAKDRELKDKLIFRGGTALRKIYLSDYRFSEDLDFLVANIENLKDYIKLIDHIIEKINLEFPYNLKERFESESDRLQLFISYDIIPEIRAAKELKLDILKDSYIPPTLNKRILFVYDAFRDEKADLRIYTLESVAVDKICRILDVDNEPQGFKNKIGYDIYYPNLLNAIKNDDYRRNWEIRLTKQIKDLPQYKSLVRELEELIEKKLIGS